MNDKNVSEYVYDLIDVFASFQNEDPHQEIVIRQGNIVLRGKVGNALPIYDCMNGVIEIELDYMQRV